MWISKLNYSLSTHHKSILAMVTIPEKTTHHREKDIAFMPCTTKMNKCRAHYNAPPVKATPRSYRDLLVLTTQWKKDSYI